MAPVRPSPSASACELLALQPHRSWRSRWPWVSTTPHLTECASAAIEALPDVLFLDGVNLVLSDRRFDVEFTARLDGRLNRLFERNAVPYRSDALSVVPSGDPLVAVAATEPALDALQQVPEFAAARTRLIKAITTFREGGATAPADALDDARHAVEFGMLAFIDAAPGAERPRKNQPMLLFTALNAAGLVGNEAMEMILGAALLRGRTEAGHAGLPPVDADAAEAAIASAAASLFYLGRRFTRLRDAGWGDGEAATASPSA